VLRAALSGALLACLALAASAEAPAGLAWVYVESNTGSSSGGHIALRVRDDVYHVQQMGGSRHRLEREAWSTFRHLYAGLGNRTLVLAHLDVADADVERAHDRLARAYVAQQSELRRLDELALDRAWAHAWRDGGAPPSLSGAGLFTPEGAPDRDALALREAVEARFGRGFLAGEIARLDAAARALPAAAHGLALRETLLLRETLRALDEAWPLAEGAALPREGLLAEPLRADEREGARRHAAAQRDAALALLAARRPDRGHALALAAARHQALARSARLGVLVLLDPYAGIGEPIAPGEGASATTWARRADELAAPLRHGRGVVLRSEGYDEAQLHLLELGAGVWADFARGAAGGPVRKLPRTALPAPARLVDFRPAATPAALAEAARAADAALAAHERRLAQLYPYGVIRRNCVTEIVRLLNDAYDGEAERALGAELDPGAGFAFIPFAFFDRVTSRLRVAEIEIVPSHRERELARVLAEDPALARRLGESVSIASTIYTPRWRDGSFLFFTDDVFWRRPLLGFANLGWAAGGALVGLATAPFDGARRLGAAGSGLWYSVPELFLFNIRKGTFEWVPAEPPADAAPTRPG
jgi:hypothetical protein